MHQEVRPLLANPILLVVLLVILVQMVFVEGPVRWLVALGPALLAITHLRVRVDERGVRPFLFPFYARMVPFEAIQEIRIEPYRWTQYGGWGVRLGKGSLAFSVWEKRAVRLVLEKRDVVIGSLDPERLVAAIEAEMALGALSQKVGA